MFKLLLQAITAIGAIACFMLAVLQAIVGLTSSAMLLLSLSVVLGIIYTVANTIDP